MRIIVTLAAAALAIACLAPAPSRTATDRHRTPVVATTTRGYAHQLTIQRWTSRPAQEWHALDTLVRYESNWDPCAVYPSQHICNYNGSNACDIPQANPCPLGWRGHLFAARYRAVRWLIRYVARRYGDPIGALAHRNATGWY